MKTIDREKLITLLENKGIVVRGLSEEFDGMDGGIWISAEETDNQFAFDYYAMNSSYDLGVHKDLGVFLERRGWYAEWYDAGTIFLWEI